jgi:hypothetical protein
METPRHGWRHRDTVGDTVRRCGELLKLIEPSKGGQPTHSTHTGTDTSRSQAAADAGLSKRQKDTAIRVANVDDDSFNEQVESENPPTVTQLAAQGFTV